MALLPFFMGVILTGELCNMYLLQKSGCVARPELWWCEIKFCVSSDIIILFAITKEVSNLNTRPWGCVYSPWTWALPSVCRGETLWFLAATLGLRCDPCSGMDWFLFCYHTLIYTTPWRNLTCCRRHHVTISLSALSWFLPTHTYRVVGMLHWQ